MVIRRTLSNCMRTIASLCLLVAATVREGHAPVLKTPEMMPVVLRATYPENQVALTKIKFP